MFDAVLFWVYTLGTATALLGRHLLTKSIRKKQGSIQCKKETPWRWWCERAVEFGGFSFVAYAFIAHDIPRGYRVIGMITDIDFVKAVGAVLFLCSIAVHLRGKYDLGINWTGAAGGPTVRRGPITVHGLYRYSRNPMYTGTLGMVLGVVLMTQNAIVVFLWVVLYVYFCSVIASEESLLRAEKGREYIEYCQRVRRFI